MARLATLAPRLATIDTSIARPLPKEADAFYRSPQWRRLITEIIAERGRRCEDCTATGCRIHGDHIKEIKDGGAPLDKNNIRLRCGGCHNRKTSRERARRAMGSSHNEQGPTSVR